MSSPNIRRDLVLAGSLWARPTETAPAFCPAVVVWELDSFAINDTRPECSRDDGMRRLPSLNSCPLPRQEGVRAAGPRLR